MYANTFLECPVDVNEMLASSETENPQDHAGTIAGMVYIYTGFQSLSTESECKTGIISESVVQESDFHKVKITTVSGNDNMLVAYDARGKKTTFTFAVINVGTQDDKYELNIASLNGWEISVDGWRNERARTIELKPRQSYLLQVWVLAPSDANKGDKEEIHLEAKSVIDESTREIGKMFLEVQ